MPAAPREPLQPRQSSVDNALRLLELLSERGDVRVADVAAELGVARSTAHRLLTSLRLRGFALQDRANGSYRPGPTLNELGLRALNRLDIRRLARPTLERLRTHIQETVSLVLLEDREVRFIDCVESPHTIRVGSRTGMVWPAHCTAAGKAILATLTPTEVDRRYPDHELTGFTDNSIIQWPDFMTELGNIRSRGYALNLEERETGICAIGVALDDLGGSLLSALGVAIPVDRLPTRQHIHQMYQPLLEATAEVRDLVLADM